MLARAHDAEAAARSYVTISMTISMPPTREATCMLLACSGQQCGQEGAQNLPSLIEYMPCSICIESL